MLDISTLGVWNPNYRRLLSADPTTTNMFYNQRLYPHLGVFLLDRISNPINPPMGMWIWSGSLPIAGKKPGTAGWCGLYRA